MTKEAHVDRRENVDETRRVGVLNDALSYRGQGME